MGGEHIHPYRYYKVLNKLAGVGRVRCLPQGGLVNLVVDVGSKLVYNPCQYQLGNP